jgi:hypothetical protein
MNCTAYGLPPAVGLLLLVGTSAVEAGPPFSKTCATGRVGGTSGHVSFTNCRRHRHSRHCHWRRHHWYGWRRCHWHRRCWWHCGIATADAGVTAIGEVPGSRRRRSMSICALTHLGQTASRVA